jgi:uncharacterized protein YecA (UPF0149 family)
MTTENNKTISEESAGKPSHQPHVHGPNCNHGHEQTPYVRASAKVGPNEPCPCGSGKKYKGCHGVGV